MSIPISWFLGSETGVDGREWSVDNRSEAKICIMSKRCSKGAGCCALSAFCVARSRTSRLGDGEDCASCSKALVAMWRCARVGGLKEESRM